ncbi:MAG: hypothetical protein FIA95_15665 [Gemmatimonadetes bacterium]|nr:hypothetical protein [Gemmatimonadota bacterium]
MTERRFTDEEVAIILRDAAEPPTGTRRARDADGLTLGQLEEIAREVGMDPARIREAAGTLVLHRSGRRLPFFGTPVAPAFEREIQGAVPTGDLAGLVTTIRRILGRRGIGSSEFGAFEWRAQGVMGGRYVSVFQRGGSVRLRVFANFRDGLLLVALGAGGVLTVMVTALLAALGGKDLLGPGVLPLGAILAALPTRALWRWVYRRQEDELAELTEARDQQLKAIPDSPPAARTAPSPAPPSPAPPPA